MRTPPFLADFIHARPCKLFCEKYLTLPVHIIFLAFGIEICYNKIVFCNYVVLKKRCKKWQYPIRSYSRFSLTEI